MPNYIHITTQGNFNEIETDEELSLEELQRYVGGYIEVAPAVLFQNKKAKTIYVNEEGLIMNLPPNYHAIGYLLSSQPLFGDVLIEMKSETFHA